MTHDLNADYISANLCSPLEIYLDHRKSEGSELLPQRSQSLAHTVITNYM